jgi:hypothetical protein
VRGRVRRPGRHAGSGGAASGRDSAASPTVPDTRPRGLDRSSGDLARVVGPRRAGRRLDVRLNQLRAHASLGQGGQEPVREPRAGRRRHPHARVRSRAPARRGSAGRHRAPPGLSAPARQRLCLLESARQRVLPTTYLVDRCGRIRVRHIGEVHSDQDCGRVLEKQLQALLDERVDCPRARENTWP